VLELLKLRRRVQEVDVVLEHLHHRTRTTVLRTVNQTREDMEVERSEDVPW
jgi:hypothetical protein